MKLQKSREYYMAEVLAETFKCNWYSDDSMPTYTEATKRPMTKDEIIYHLECQNEALIKKLKQFKDYLGEDMTKGIEELEVFMKGELL